MKKMIVALAMIGLAVGVYAEGSYVTGSIVTAANKTVFTNIVTLAADANYKDVYKLVFLNNSSETGTVVVATSDNGVFTQVASVALNPAASSVTYPVVAGTYGTSTNMQLFAASKLRLITTLNATNAVVSTIKYAVFAK